MAHNRGVSGVASIAWSTPLTLIVTGISLSLDLLFETPEPNRYPEGRSWPGTGLAGTLTDKATMRLLACRPVSGKLSILAQNFEQEAVQRTKPKRKCNNPVLSRPVVERETTWP
jgi:hypothetical protein